MRRILLIILMIGMLTYLPGELYGEPSNIESKAAKLTNTLQEVRARGKLVVGVRNDEPPFGFIDENGTLNGIDIDIAKALAQEIFGKEDKLGFVPVTIENMIDLLTSGKIDILLTPLSITEERKMEIEFSTPYFISGDLILVEKDSKISLYQDLAGKNVATLQDTKGDTIIGELVPTAKRIRFHRNSEALQALKEHKVDAFIQLDVFVFYMEERNRNLKVVGLQAISPNPLTLGVRKGDKEWLNFVDITLLKMMATSEYRKLLDKWFGKVRGELLEGALRKEIK